MIEGALLAALGLLLHAADRCSSSSLLFPFYWMIITTFRPDAELYRPWNAPNYTPFWTTQPDPRAHPRPARPRRCSRTWMWNTMLIALVVDGRSRCSAALLAGYALARLKFPFAGSLGTGIFVTYLVPQTLLFIPLADIIRNFQLGDTPWALILTYPTFLIPFCTWLLMGYFKADPEGARGVRPHRRRDALAGDGLHHLPGGGARHPVGRHLRLHAVVERVHLRPGLPVLARAEDRAGRRRLGADPRRRVLLGPADGRRAARLDPGRDRLFVLRRALRRPASPAR